MLQLKLSLQMIFFLICKFKSKILLSSPIFNVCSKSRGIFFNQCICPFICLVSSVSGCALYRTRQSLKTGQGKEIFFSETRQSSTWKQFVKYVILLYFTVSEIFHLVYSYCRKKMTRRSTIHIWSRFFVFTSPDVRERWKTDVRTEMERKT